MMAVTWVSILFSLSTVVWMHRLVRRAHRRTLRAQEGWERAVLVAEFWRDQAQKRPDRERS